MHYLVKFDEMKHAIQECYEVDEIKLIRDKAEAYRYALIQAKQSPEYIRKAEEIKLRAERRAGELLKEIIKPGNPQLSQPTTIEKLPDFGITRDQSANWQKIASIPEETFEEYLHTSKEITTSGAIRIAQKTERENISTPALPEGKYRVIYADPPWDYGEHAQHGKKEQKTTLASHYASMSNEELCSLPINDLTLNDAVLFIWVTSPLLEGVFKIISAWGFQYKTSMVWDKVKHNVGYYVSVRHEFLLICTKGSCLPKSKKLFDSVQTIERSDIHSEKPAKFYQIIEEMYSPPYIELFARKERKGWKSWGNAIKNL